jgi:hypothetical protein
MTSDRIRAFAQDMISFPLELAMRLPAGIGRLLAALLALPFCLILTFVAFPLALAEIAVLFWEMANDESITTPR